MHISGRSVEQYTENIDKLNQILKIFILRLLYNVHTALIVIVSRFIWYTLQNTNVKNNFKNSTGPNV